MVDADAAKGTAKGAEQCKKYDKTFVYL